jgi:putative ABC transport system permease protein
MTLHPILAALRKNLAGPVLITLQIALTLAIVCNAIFIIGQRVERMERPTGMNESELFLVTQQWVGAPSPDDAAGLATLDAMQREDLAELKKMPDVASVASMSSLPLLNSSRDSGVGLTPGQQGANAHTVLYFGDEGMLPALGLRLVAGRAFVTGEIGHQSPSETHEPATVIVTSALAEKLFPIDAALGKAIYFNGGTRPATIIGVVERLQVSTTHNWATNFTWNSVLVPIRLDSNTSSYAVRARPGQLEEAMKAIPSSLYAVNPMRVLDDRSVRSFADIRAEAYRSDLGMAILMGVICLILLAVTAAGIVGLSSFWVGQRYKQIGIRRALGARKIDILHYFQIENLVIACAGAVIGTLLALGLNLWLIHRYEMDRMPVIYVLAGVALVLMLGQLAVFAPARRASHVPPVAATRAG